MYYERRDIVQNVVRIQGQNFPKRSAVMPKFALYEGKKILYTKNSLLMCYNGLVKRGVLIREFAVRDAGSEGFDSFGKTGSKIYTRKS